MITFRKNTRLRLVRSLVFILILAVLCSAFWVFADFRLRAVAQNFAKSAVKTLVLDSANAAMLSAVQELNVAYDDIAKISRNEQGLATSVEIDSVAANKMKAYICNAVSKELSSRQDVSFKVPLSAAFGLYYSSLAYPRLSYTVGITTTVYANFDSVFVGAGINQVLHQIVLNLSLESDLAMKGAKTEQIITTNYIVAQTVIVGTVPDAFTSVGHATDEVMEDIFDFGATAE